MWVSEITEENLSDDMTTRKDNWMNSEVGRQRARAEALNIVKCVNNGVFPDFEI